MVIGGKGGGLGGSTGLQSAVFFIDFCHELILK